MGGYLRFMFALPLCLGLSASSFFSSGDWPDCSTFNFSLSFFRAFSRILTCLPSDSCNRLLVLPSPSSLPMRDFISARSICHALRSRSCRCHSVCRNRITPVGCLHVSSYCQRRHCRVCPAPPGSKTPPYLVTCTLFLEAAHCSHPFH